MADVIASLVATLGLDASGFDSGLRSAKKGISGLSDGFGSLGKSLTTLTAPLAVFGATGIKTASNFEAVMSDIEARAGLTAKEMQKVSKYALQMGADTVFSGQQSGEAILQLLTSGQDLQDVYATMPHVLNAAAASGDSLGKTADNVTNILAAWQMEADQSKRVVDTLTKAAGASSATFGELADGFANLGGTAKQFGIAFEDTTAILAIFRENGIAGSEAGTQLRSMLNNMSRDTDKTTAAWKALGTSMFDANGKARPIAEVMEDIRRGMAGMTDEQRTQVIQDLAGSFGQLGLTALTSSISIEQMRKKMNGAADASTIATKKMSTFDGKIESLKGSIEAKGRVVLLAPIHTFAAPAVRMARI